MLSWSLQSVQFRGFSVLCSEYLSVLCRSSSIRMVVSKSLQWIECVACTVETRNAYKTISNHLKHQERHCRIIV